MEGNQGLESDFGKGMGRDLSSEAQEELLDFVQQVQDQLLASPDCSRQELLSWIEVYNRKYRSWRGLWERKQSELCSRDSLPEEERSCFEEQRFEATQGTEHANTHRSETIQGFLERYFVARKQTDCRKWDGMEVAYSRTDLLPFWVADLDFAPPETLTEAVQDRMQHQALGYALRPDSYFEAMRDWLQIHAGYSPESQWLVSVPSVGTGLTWALEAWTQEGEGILSFVPGYPFFKKTIEDNRRTFYPSTLLHQNGSWFIQWEELDQIYQEAQSKGQPLRAVLLCSPHNPCGRLWTREELQRLLNWCERHQLLLLADEIHQDWILGEKPFVSVLAVCSEAMRQQVAVLHSLSKTFGLAGIPQANLLIPDADLRQQFEQWMDRIYPAKPHALNWVILEAAYRTGSNWLEGCKAVLRENLRLGQEWLKQDLPLAVSSFPEAGFLWFVDLGAYIPAQSLKWVMEDLCQIAVSYGESFGGPSYATWVRINLGTHPDLLREGFQRISHAIAQLEYFRTRTGAPIQR